MTDYDYFPPIRFRFSGDVDQAKGRIPQARTLMAQLIRRMEGFGRDTGQWQGQMSDGTQFRVAKMGDVHVADIFGVTPSVEQPVTARGVAYDLRVITPGATMVASPETVIPETVIPEIPDAPHTPPRDILMRPHGERFDSGDGYLWVGVEVDLTRLPPDVFSSAYGESTNTYHEVYKRPYGGGAILESTYSDQDAVLYGDKVILPTINIMLFEPGWAAQESKATILQTLSLHQSVDIEGNAGVPAYDKDASPIIYQKFNTTYSYDVDLTTENYMYYHSYLGNALYAKGSGDYAGSWETYPNDYTDCHQHIPQVNYKWNRSTLSPSSPYEPSMTAVMPGNLFLESSSSDLLNRTAELQQVFVKTDKGTYSSYPYINGGGRSLPVDAYVAVIKSPYTWTVDNSVNANLTSDGAFKTSGNDLASFFEQVLTESSVKNYQVDSDFQFAIVGAVEQHYRVGGVGECIPDSSVLEINELIEVNVVNDTSVYEIQYVTQTQTQITTAEDVGLSFSYPAESIVLDGLYEVRLAAGGVNDLPPDSPIPCNAYIQFDPEKSASKFEIEIAASGSEDEIYFNTSAWFADKTPTPITPAWYPGCWLIDIKNKTIIHETDPANLTRDWFTTE